MINAVTSCEVLSAFRYCHPDYFKTLSGFYDFVEVDGIVLFKRKTRKILEIRNFMFGLLDLYSDHVNHKFYSDAWVVREILDTIILTLK